MVGVSRLPAVRVLEDPREREFVALVANGASPMDAAARIGCVDRREYFELMGRPGILAAIHQGVQRALAEDAPVSLKILKELRDSSDTPERTRADIALKLLAMAGHGAADRKGPEAKPLSEMSSAELAAFAEANRGEIDRLENEIAARAKDVSAPVSQQPPAKPLPFLD